MREALEARMLSGSGRLAQGYHEKKPSGVEHLSEPEEKQIHTPWHRDGADKPVEKLETEAHH